MTDTTTAPRKRKGPPRRNGPGTTIGVRLQPKSLASLDQAVTDQCAIQHKPITRAGLMRGILRQWIKANNYG